MSETKNKEMNKKIVIREAVLTDLFEIRRIKCEGFWDEMVKYHNDPTFFVSPEGYAREFQYLENKDRIYHNYIALLDDHIIAGCTVTEEGNGHYYVNVVYVSMKHQDEGVGSILMEHVLKQFTDARYWHLETPYLSYRNHHFYEKLGFVKAGETEPEADGFYLFKYELLR